MLILKKIAAIFLKISVSAALLIFLFKQVDAKALLGIIKSADKPLLFLSFGLTFFIYLLCFLRWKMLLNASGVNPPLLRLVSAFSGGIFFNSFMPSTIGGDFVRGADLAVHTKKTSEVVATVFLDRLSGYIGVVTVALSALFFGRNLIQDKIVYLSIITITLILVFILLIIFNKYLFFLINKLLSSSHAGKIRTALGNIHKEIFYFRKHKKTVWKNILLSVLIQAISPLGGYLIASAFGIKISPVYFFIFLPIIGAITLLPISIGGLGLRDTMTVYFFAKAGIDRHLSFAMSLLGFFFLTVYAVIGGIIYVFALRHRRV
jgi:uncharacterized protein (TIRG00374 family)